MKRIDRFFNPHNEEHLHQLEEYLYTGEWNRKFISENNIIINESMLMNVFKIISFAWIRQKLDDNKSKETTSKENDDKLLQMTFVENIKGIGSQNELNEKYGLGKMVKYDDQMGSVIDVAYIRNKPRALVQFSRTDYRWIELDKVTDANC